MIPATACLVEFEEVLKSSFNADLACPFINKKDSSISTHYDTIIYVALTYGQLSKLIRKTENIVSHSTSIAYVFDAFISPRLKRLPPFVKNVVPQLKAIRALDHIFSPINVLKSQHQEFFNTPISYMPIGVDALKFGSLINIEKKFITINGYGRQLPSTSNYFADQCNKFNNGIYYHTDHFKIDSLTDPIRHRRLFWKLLAHSQFALAYSPESYDPSNRFDCSFVGQRWFESMAAGCVIIGKKPKAPETNELFDWENALIDLSDNPEEAWEQTQKIKNNTDFMVETSKNNYRHTLRRHDWRIRIHQIANQFSIELSDNFKSEFETVMSTNIK